MLSIHNIFRLSKNLPDQYQNRNTSHISILGIYYQIKASMHTQIIIKVNTIEIPC